jgi:hypothetical protein
MMQCSQALKVEPGWNRPAAANAFANVLGTNVPRACQARAKRDPLPYRAGTTTLMPRPRRCDSQRVKRWWPHRTAAAREQLIAELERAVPLDVAARACCCPARPVVTVVMPPTASRPHPVELLLCGHHFRISQASLQAAGADVYDKAGLLIMAGTGTAGTQRPGAGRLVGTARGYRD